MSLRLVTAVLSMAFLAVGILFAGRPADPSAGPTQPPRDPAAEAVAAKTVPAERPEQKLTDHDKSDKFDWKKPAPLTPALKDQPNGGRIAGFEFSRDPLGADKPFTTLAEVMAKESAAKPK